jgi:uridylate kinase
MPAYRRVLLKLSGEAFAGEAEWGLSSSRVSEIAQEVAACSQANVQIGVVVGGGNFFRGVTAGQAGLRRVTADYMGMLATAINALAFRDAIEAAGGRATVMSAVPMEPVLPGFSRREALEGLGRGEVVIFAAGTGSPFFTTDTAASLRAVEIEAEVLAKATKVDGVFDKDPVHFSGARRYEKISYAEVLAQGLRVMDATAVALCQEHRLPVVVFNLNTHGNIRRLVAGEPIGTLVS